MDINYELLQADLELVDKKSKEFKVSSHGNCGDIFMDKVRLKRLAFIRC